MASFNKVILVGNLTRDPELKYTPGGAALCELSVAVNEKWKDQSGDWKEHVNFITCVAWATTAENAAKYLATGSPVMVEGRWKQERWEDKETGQKRSRDRVMIDNLQFLGTKRDSGKSQDSNAHNGGDRFGYGSSPPQPQTSSGTMSLAAAPASGSTPPNEDIPF